MFGPLITEANKLTWSYTQTFWEQRTIRSPARGSWAMDEQVMDSHSARSGERCYNGSATDVSGRWRRTVQGLGTLDAAAVAARVSR